MPQSFRDPGHISVEVCPESTKLVHSVRVGNPLDIFPVNPIIRYLTELTSSSEYRESQVCSSPTRTLRIFSCRMETSEMENLRFTHTSQMTGGWKKVHDTSCPFKVMVQVKRAQHQNWMSLETYSRTCLLGEKVM